MKRLHEGDESLGRLRPLRWGAKFGADILQKDQRRERRQAAKSLIKPLHESVQDAMPPPESDDGVPLRDPRHTGRALLASFDGAFRYLFRHSSIRLGEKQKRLIDVATVAMLGRMFRNDLVANLKWLRRRFLIDALIDTLAVLFPRRSGKTEAAAILIAVIVVSLPYGNCMMYTLTARHAREFLDSVWSYVEKFKDSSEYGFTIKSRNLDRYYKINCFKWNTLNTVQAFGGAQQGEAKIDCRIGTTAAAAAYTDCEETTAATQPRDPPTEKRPALFF